MKRRLFRLTAALLLCATQARATTIAPFTFDQLCEKAEAVYRVQCVGSRSVWDDARRTIYTVTTLRVLDPVKGEAREITLRLPGGTVNDTTLTIPDFPVFHDGDDRIIFLTGQDSAGFPWPVGMGQGIYTVFKDASLTKVALRPGPEPLPAGPSPLSENPPLRPSP